MKELYSARERKVKMITDRYEGRNYRQRDIASELGIPVKVVARVTQLCGYEHTKKKSNNNPNNLNEGQHIKPVHFLKEFAFLDKYDIGN